MSEVTILATNVVNTGGAVGGWFAIIIGILAIAYIIGYSICECEPQALIFCFLMLPFLFIGAAIIKDDVPVTHYTATISENVSLTEFMDKYDIVSKNGDLYIIKDKEEE